MVGISQCIPETPRSREEVHVSYVLGFFLISLYYFKSNTLQNWSSRLSCLWAIWSNISAVFHPITASWLSSASVRNSLSSEAHSPSLENLPLAPYFEKKIWYFGYEILRTFWVPFCHYYVEQLINLKAGAFPVLSGQFRNTWRKIPGTLENWFETITRILRNNKVDFFQIKRISDF